MKYTIKEQMTAIQRVRTVGGMLTKKGDAKLNAAANTLAAINFMLSNVKEVEKEFTLFTAQKKNLSEVYYSPGELMVMYLKEKGLPL